MADLEVATADLEYLGSRVKDLGDDLKRGDGKADYSVTQLAHNKVVDAMDNFRGNWNDHRDHLADKLGGLAKTAAEKFTEADEELAEELHKIMKDAKQ